MTTLSSLVALKTVDSQPPIFLNMKILSWQLSFWSNVKHQLLRPSPVLLSTPYLCKQAIMFLYLAEIHPIQEVYSSTTQALYDMFTGIIPFCLSYGSARTSWKISSSGLNDIWLSKICLKSLITKEALNSHAELCCQHCPCWWPGAPFTKMV